MLLNDLDADDQIECTPKGPDGSDLDGFWGDETENLKSRRERMEITQGSSLGQCTWEVGIRRHERDKSIRASHGPRRERAAASEAGLHRPGHGTCGPCGDLRLGLLLWVLSCSTAGGSAASYLFTRFSGVCGWFLSQAASVSCFYIGPNRPSSLLPIHHHYLLLKSLYSPPQPFPSSPELHRL